VEGFELDARHGVDRTPNLPIEKRVKNKYKTLKQTCTKRVLVIEIEGELV